MLIVSGALWADITSVWAFPPSMRDATSSQCTVVPTMQAATASVWTASTSMWITTGAVRSITGAMWDAGTTVWASTSSVWAAARPTRDVACSMGSVSDSS